MGLLIEPKFRTRDELPTTDAANVKENIDNWLDNKNIGDCGKRQLASVCRPDPKGHRGYRFVSAEDFNEVHVVHQVVGKTPVKVTWKRFYYNNDRFNPFWFGILRTEKWVSINGHEEFLWVSDADLKRKVKAYTTWKINPYENNS